MRSLPITLIVAHARERSLDCVAAGESEWSLVSRTSAIARTFFLRFPGTSAIARAFFLYVATSASEWSMIFTPRTTAARSVLHGRAPHAPLFRWPPQRHLHPEVMPLAPANRSRLHALVACAGTFFLYWRFPGNLAAALVVLGAVLAGLAWLLPRAYVPIQHGLDALAQGILVSITWVVLGLLYFGLFTPLRFWRELTRQDPLRLRRGPTPESYLQPLPRTAPRFDRQF